MLPLLHPLYQLVTIAPTQLLITLLQHLLALLYLPPVGHLLYHLVVHPHYLLVDLHLFQLEDPLLLQLLLWEVHLPLQHLL